MNTERRSNATKLLRRLVLAIGLALLTTLFSGCGEGTLPPVPPPPTGTINFMGSAV
jgi:hypothetical protein